MNSSEPQPLPPVHRRRARLGVIWPLALVAVLACVWSAYWYAGHLGAQEAFARWQAREAEAGRSFTCGERSHGGYPFRFEMHCESPRYEIVRDGRTTVIRADGVHTVSMAYTPNRLIAEFDGPLYVEADDGTVVESDWDTSRMSLRVAPVGVGGRPEITRADLETSGPLLNYIPEPGRTAAAYRAEAFQLHFRKAEGAGTTEANYDLAWSSVLPVLELPGSIIHSADRIDFLGNASQVDTLYSGAWTDRLEKWRAAGGSLRIDAARVTLGNALAVIDGDLKLDGNGRPQGRVNLTTAGLDISQFAGENGLGLSGIAVLSIGALGTPTEIDGRKASRLSLRISNGTLFLGPLGLAQLPSLTGQ